MEQIGGLWLTEKLARKLVYVPHYANDAFTDESFETVLCEKDWTGVITAETMHVAVNKESFLYEVVLFGLLAGVFPAEYSHLTVQEQEQYQSAVSSAESDGRYWRHPSFVQYSSHDAAFLAWIEASREWQWHLNNNDRVAAPRKHSSGVPSAGSNN